MGLFSLLFVLRNRMPRPNGITLKDVPAKDFVKAYAAHLRRTKAIKVPAWADLVKTGKLKELAPYDSNWYFVRAAGVARKVYLKKGLGVGTLRKIYGGSLNRGTAPSQFCRSSGGLLRHVLQDLEAINVVAKDTKGGRVITSTGRRDLDRIAGRIARTKYSAQLKLAALAPAPKAEEAEPAAAEE